MNKKTKTEKWFKPSNTPLNWHKDDLPRTRRIKALQSRKGDLLATARALNALANVTREKSVKKLARIDAQYFFDRYKKENKSEK